MRCLLPRLKEKCLYFLGCPHRQPRGSLPPPGRAAGAAARRSPGSPPAAPRGWGGGYACLLGGDGSGRRVSQWAPQKSPFGERVLGSGRGPASEGVQGSHGQVQVPGGAGCGGRPCSPRTGISTPRGRGGVTGATPMGRQGASHPEEPPPAAALSPLPAPSHPLDPAPGGSSPRRRRREGCSRQLRGNH